ncbi:CD99 antigen [Motacilla alba alba]|uniref:CD99 antigen n=1 Tax=Motacilla alba alba TaxID=1094192 RepID=UPI0018D4F586|nr:CD99 antigen [Motacilla alba alba]
MGSCCYVRDCKHHFFRRYRFRDAKCPQHQNVTQLRLSVLHALPLCKNVATKLWQAARQRSGLSSTTKSSLLLRLGQQRKPSSGGSRSYLTAQLEGGPWGAAARARWGGGPAPPLPPGEQLGAAALGAAGGSAWCVSACEFVGRAAMRRWRLLLLPALLAVLVSVRGQDDFSLEDALPEGNTKKPPVTQKTPSLDGGDLDLSDAFDFGDPKPHPPANPSDTDKPKQDQPKDSDKFDDSDLWDGSYPRGGSDGSGSNERKGPNPESGQEGEGSQGVIAGIISAVGATVVASVGSFIAYQKKKLCFKQSADEENVNMDSLRGAQSEPPVQRTLLEN